MKKWNIIMIMVLFLVLIQTAIACKDWYNVEEEIIILDVIESDGRGAMCNLTLYTSNQTLNQSGIMNMSGLSYSYNASQLPRDTYSASIECNNTGTDYYGDCKFKVGSDVEMWEITLGLILICLTGIIFYLATLMPNFDLKLIFATLGALFIVIDLWFAYRITDLLSGSTGITNNVLVVYEISLIGFKFLFSIVVFLLMLRAILFFRAFAQKRKKEQEGWSLE
jgi:hypothetical protein